MSKRTYVAHINCTPWIEDGRWNIIIERDYHHVTGLDGDEGGNSKLVEEILESALDNGTIHSYYIQRPNDDAPIVHLPESNSAEG